MDSLSFNFIGIVLQMAGVSLGAWTLREIIFKKRPGLPIGFAYDETKNLPRDEKNQPIYPFRINRIAAAISVSCIIVGLGFQLGAI